MLELLIVVFLVVCILAQAGLYILEAPVRKGLRESRLSLEDYTRRCKLVQIYAKTLATLGVLLCFVAFSLLGKHS